MNNAEWKATPHPFNSGLWAVSSVNDKGQRNHVHEGVGIVPLVRAFSTRDSARAYADGINKAAQE